MARLDFCGLLLPLARVGSFATGGSVPGGPISYNEAVTNSSLGRLPPTSTDPDPRSGWVDSGGAETADKCAWTFGSRQLKAANGSTYNMTLGSRNYLIQRNLAATDNKCYIDWVSKIQ